MGITGSANNTYRLAVIHFKTFYQTLKVFESMDRVGFPCKQDSVTGTCKMVFSFSILSQVVAYRDIQVFGACEIVYFKVLSIFGKCSGLVTMIYIKTNAK